jgi:hypothetical protein
MLYFLWTTIVSLVFVPIFFKLIFHPWLELRDLISKIAYELTFNENNLYRQPGVPLDSTEKSGLQRKFREFASLLEPTASKICMYDLLSSFRITLPITDLQEAKSALIGLSNGFVNIQQPGDRGYQHEAVDNIRTLLRINKSKKNSANNMLHNPWFVTIVSGLAILLLTITIQRVFFTPKIKITSEGKITIETRKKKIITQGSLKHPAIIEPIMKAPKYNIQ